jgi:transposase-like protein
MEKRLESWSEHVAAAKRDPVSMVAYAQRHGIAIATLRYWSVKFNQQKRTMAVVAEAAAGKFVALRINHKQSHAPESSTLSCTLMLSGMTLTIPSLPAPEWLAALCHAMRGIQ